MNVPVLFARMAVVDSPLVPDIDPLAHIIRISPSVQPEKKLLVEVLANGIDESRGVIAEACKEVMRARLTRQASEWLRDRATKTPFSAAYICDVLDIDQEWLIAGVDATTAPLRKVTMHARRRG